MIFLLYLILNGLFHGIYFFLLKKAKSDKQELYDRYKSINKIHWKFPIILFPLPHYFVYQKTKKYLKYLREAPRYSKVTGMVLMRLNTVDEKKHLNKGQITEEEIGSVDYDVWITEDESDILILRYDAFFTRYGECPKCTYDTYYNSQSRVIINATYDETGLREDFYECKNCNFQRIEEVVIPQKERPSNEDNRLRNKRSFNSVEIFDEEEADEDRWDDINKNIVKKKDIISPKGSSRKKNKIHKKSNNNSGSKNWGGGSSGGGGAGTNW